MAKTWAETMAEMAASTGTHCEVCGERCEGEHPGAKVFHMSCLMASTEHMRTKETK